MVISFEHLGWPVARETVAAFEAGLPGQLPDDYRDFLLTCNGGRPERNWWPPEVSAAGFAVALFYQLNPGDVSNCVITAQRRLRGQLPAHLLAIAADIYGNPICLSLAQADRGRVFFVVRRNGELVLDPLVPVAPSFDQLLLALEPVPWADEMSRRVAAASASAVA